MKTQTSAKRLAAGVALTLSTFGIGAVQGQEHSCLNVMKYETSQQLKQMSPALSQAGLEAALCSSSVDQDKGSQFSELGLSPGLKKASASILCNKRMNEPRLKSKQRVLSKVFGNSALRSFERCLALQKKGIQIDASEASESNREVQIAVEINDSRARLMDIEIEPAGSATCSGSLSLEEMRRDPLRTELWGTCRHNGDVDMEAARVRLRFSSGFVDLNVSPPAPTPPADISDGNIDWTLQPLPQIEGCEIESVADRILRCDTQIGQWHCYRAIEEGSVRDCRIQFREQLYRNRREVRIEHAPGEYAFRTRGTLGVSVERRNRSAAQLHGEMFYTINFTTPSRPATPANQCDRSCPLFGDIEPCNRNCVFADHVLETEPNMGILQLSREAGNSCEAPLTGSVRLTDIDKHRAYNLCESANAWGGRTRGYLHVQVSKFYYFNNYSTTHRRTTVVRSGRRVQNESWQVSNSGERVRAIAALRLPFDITCNE